ncbi:MAG TPA: hypothetical protein VL547_18585 [Dinghuibacter sp.]|uniref:hypothetical protein n=1 Tax=Dinghuibacter sp. TaxID=2024697 RepID=UPI002CE2162E|nr:hypothetical protein [Dinghuibacter sp.]HTJ14055.1 hypothetical protein [Dinghuibacter sp.]
MKGLFFAAAAAAVAVLAGCAQGSAPQGHFQSTPVAADGRADDWAQPLRFTNPRHTLSFNITNDNKNLYIVVMTRDSRMQQRILRAGMDVFFDPGGKQDRHIDLSYPESNGDSAVFNTSGFLIIENGQFDSRDPHTPLKVALTHPGDSLLVYEAIVPLYTVLKRGGLDSKTLRRDFSVGIVVGTLPGEQQQRQRQGGGGGMRPHMGMGMGMGGLRGGFGGGGYGGGGNRGGQPTQASQNESNWYTFRFADKAS